MGHSSDRGEGENHFPNDPDTKKQTTKCIIWTTLAVCLILFRKKKIDLYLEQNPRLEDGESFRLVLNGIFLYSCNVPISVC